MSYVEPTFLDYLIDFCVKILPILAHAIICAIIASVGFNCVYSFYRWVKYDLFE